MCFYAKIGSLAIHIIRDASIISALENLEVVGTIVHQDINDCEED